MKPVVPVALPLWSPRLKGLPGKPRCNSPLTLSAGKLFAMRQLLASVGWWVVGEVGGAGGEASRWMFGMGETLIAGSEWNQRSRWFVYGWRAERSFMKGDKKQDISCFCCRLSCLTGEGGGGGGDNNNNKKNIPSSRESCRQAICLPKPFLSQCGSMLCSVLLSWIQ